MNPNSFKDPIYGYIETDNESIKIIDSPYFQRLKDIIQTSYPPLYSTALHNRFSHSLGVYHLGKIALKNINKNLKKRPAGITKADRRVIKKNENDLIIACLLHDIGHAPFSHTGEGFFDTSKGITTLKSTLKDLIKNKNFRRDLLATKLTSQHEIMSAIVGIKAFHKEIKDTEFLARCIIGCHYSDNSDIRNCLIDILNSSLIDVDRLDYIIRDGNNTGFQTTSIDYPRLLNGLILANNKNKKEIVYDISAISSIENAIFAHESQKKWIQNHPIIIYDIFLLQHGIETVEKYLSVEPEEGKSTIVRDNEKLFSYNAITPKGIKFKSGIEISLLSDSDIIFFMKNCCRKKDTLIEEYFDRSKRRSPLWKSESEYNYLFNKYIDEKDQSLLFNIFSLIGKFEAEAQVNAEKDKIPPLLLGSSMLHIAKEKMSVIKQSRFPKNKRREINASNTLYLLIREFKIFANRNNIDFDFLIFFPKKLSTNYSKEKLTKVKVFFNTSKTIEYFSCVDPSHKVPNEPTGDCKDFFYFYYKKREKTNKSKIQKDFWYKLCPKLLEIYKQNTN